MTRAAATTDVAASMRSSASPLRALMASATEETSAPSPTTPFFSTLTSAYQSSSSLPRATPAT